MIILCQLSIKNNIRGCSIFKLIIKKLSILSFGILVINSGIFGGNLDNPAKVSANEFIKAYNVFINKYNDYDIDVLLCALSDKEYEEIKDIKEGSRL